MPNDQAITLTGIAIDNETAMVILRPVGYHSDGIDIATSVKVLEYEFKVETFFFGYNLELFLQEAEKLVARQAPRAHLFNYNETLVLEFISESAPIFLSLKYKSVLPQAPEDAPLKALRSASHLDSTSILGSRFSFSFMPLHNPISEVTDWLWRVLADHPVSKENPYPH